MTNQTRGGPAASGDRGRFEEREDVVARLVRLADSGSEPPAGGADLVRQAVRPAWRAAVRARVMRRRLTWAAAGLAAAASVTFALWLGPLDERPLARPAPVATLAAVTGELELLPALGAPVRLTGSDLGHDLVEGSTLVTSAGDRAALTLSGGACLRLDRNTSILLVSAAAVELARGGVYLDTGQGSAGDVEVRTSLGVARDVGTQFEVRRSGQTLTVRVREGTVLLTRGEDQLEITGGSQATVAGGAAAQLAALAASAREWDWVQEVAPPFAIEGRTAADFLAWVGRETGREVRFAEVGAERSAARTILHGTLGGMSPGVAIDVVLPGCGLEARREDGMIVVSQLPLHEGPGPS